MAPSSFSYRESSDDDEDPSPPAVPSGGGGAVEGRKRRSESLPPNMGATEGDQQYPTMWLGTEDGFVHVYSCSDTIRIKKNKFKFQLGSSVQCIM